MNTFVALLRGINVGGNNLLPMQEFRDTLSAIGLKNPRTYIQSGNAAFETGQTDTAALGREIQAAIKARHGFSPAVLVLSVKDLQAAIDNNPYATHAGAPKTTHLFFLAATPASAAFEKAEALRADTEACNLNARVFYLYAPDGVGRSRLASGAERALGVSATARNLRSAGKILELAQKSRH